MLDAKIIGCRQTEKIKALLPHSFGKQKTRQTSQTVVMQKHHILLIKQPRCRARRETHPRPAARPVSSHSGYGFRKH